MKKDKLTEDLEELAKKLNLDDTIEPLIEKIVDERGRFTGNLSDDMEIREVIRNLRITKSGWAEVRSNILSEIKNVPEDIYDRVLEAEGSDDFLFSLLALIQVPYILAKHIGYTSKYSEEVSLLLKFAFTLAMYKGYQYGRQEMEEGRA